MDEPRDTTPHPEPRILLASLSPRRRRLLALLGVDFDVHAVDTPEDLSSPLASDAAALAAHLAAEKAIAAHAEGLDSYTLVLTFDTVVVLDGRILGKPRDEADAVRMLSDLSGRTHQVVTGTAVLLPGIETPETFAVTTNVRMEELDEARIAEWMALGEYAGCAGAYNIESQIAGVDEHACYQNVAGLPLCHLYAFLKARVPEIAASLVEPVGPCNSALGRSCLLGPCVTHG